MVILVKTLLVVLILVSFCLVVSVLVLLFLVLLIVLVFATNDIPLAKETTASSRSARH